MSTQIAPRELSDMAQRLHKNATEIEFISKKYCNGAPPIEVEHFIRYCHAHGLDISAKHAYLIGRKDNRNEMNYTIQIAIDGYRAMAEQTGNYDGQDEPAFQYDKNGKLFSAKVSVYRKGMSRPVTAVAIYSEYVQASSPIWGKMPHSQLAKCAEALALRKAFPSKLGGSYITEEMDQAGPVIEHAPVTTIEEVQKPALAAPEDHPNERNAIVYRVCQILEIDRNSTRPQLQDAMEDVKRALGLDFTPNRLQDLSTDDLRRFIDAHAVEETALAEEVVG